MDPFYFIEQGFSKFKQNWTQSSVIMLFYYLINYFLSIFFGVAFLSFLSKTIFLESIGKFLLDLPFGVFLMSNTTFLIIIGIILLLINILIEYGCYSYFYKMNKDNSGEVIDIFYGFTHIFKFTCLTILKTIIISFGFMLFIIPGIVFSLMYSLTSFVCAEDSSRGIIEILRESRQMMKGRKFTLLVINIILYFIQLGINIIIGFLSFTGLLYAIIYVVAASIISAYSMHVLVTLFMEAKNPVMIKTPFEKDSECDQAGGNISSFDDEFPESFEEFEDNIKNDNEDDENRFE